jgi:hypothetical protein
MKELELKKDIRELKKKRGYLRKTGNEKLAFPEVLGFRVPSEKKSEPLTAYQSKPLTVYQ